MKDLAKFTSELIFTLVLAAVISVLVSGVALFVTANLNISDEAMPSVNYLGGILFGLIVGYKLNELVHHKPAAKKKK